MDLILTINDERLTKQETWSIYESAERIDLLRDSLRAALEERDALMEEVLAAREYIESIGSQTTRCVYCGLSFSWASLAKDITEHIENCESHPAHHWKKEAELYKSEFLGRDLAWKGERAGNEMLKADLAAALAQLAEKEGQLCAAIKVADVATIYSGNIGHSRKCRQVQEAQGLYQCFCRYEELIAALEDLPSTISCRHAAEADALRSELSVAMAASKAKVSNELLEMMEEIYQEETVGCTEHEIKIITEFMEGFRKLAKDNRELLSAELRRRVVGAV